MLSLFRKFKRKTLKRNVHRYVSRKKDICCEQNMDRNQIIEHIFHLYSEMYKDMYLNELQQDMTKLIGDKSDMKKQQEYRGVSLWDELHNKTLLEGNVDKDAVASALHEVPLYYILSLLGYAYYRFKEDVFPMSQEKSARPSVTSPMKSPSTMKSPMKSLTKSPMKSPSPMISPTSPKI